MRMLPIMLKMPQRASKVQEIQEDVTNHSEDATESPDNQGHVNTPRGGKDSSGRDEDATANDTTNDHSTSVQQTHLCF